MPVSSISHAQLPPSFPPCNHACLPSCLLAFLPSFLPSFPSSVLILLPLKPARLRSALYCQFLLGCASAWILRVLDRTLALSSSCSNCRCVGTSFWSQCQSASNHKHSLFEQLFFMSGCHTFEQPTSQCPKEFEGGTWLSV